MAFNRTNFSGNIGAGSNAPKISSHKDLSSTKAEIAASGYFNDLSNIVANGDFIMIKGSDGSAVLFVTSAAKAIPVTTAEASLA